MTTSPLIYGITPQCSDSTQLVDMVEQALKGGVEWIQYRDKHRPISEQVVIAKELKARCHNHAAQLIINDHIEVCEAAGAHGVHLGQSDGAATAARLHLGPDAIIGVTCHQSVDLAHKAAKEGASYAAFGACFPSKTKPQAQTLDRDKLQSIVAAIHLPYVLIGGIELNNVHSLLPYKPEAIAICNALFGRKDIHDAAKRWCSSLSQET